MDYDNLHVYWAIAAMRLACALNTQEKRLCMHLEPGELICLAELLKQKCDLRGLLVYGMIHFTLSDISLSISINHNMVLFHTVRCVHSIYKDTQMLPLS